MKPGQPAPSSVRHRSKLPPQVIRLILLASAIVGSYLVARELLTPPSFNQYGFYRGAALAEMASREPVFGGRAACAECHDDIVKQLAAHEHKNLSCEGCHGAGQAHVENPDVKLAILTYSHCVRCHEANSSRPKAHKQIVAREHYPGDKCTECHVPHQPQEVP